MTYNRSHYLRKSLPFFLSQNYEPGTYEVIVADDGSTDGTKELVAEWSKSYPNLKYVYHKHQGIAGARNLGINVAKGRVICFAADDYVISPLHLKKITEIFQKYPNAEVVRFRVLWQSDKYFSNLLKLFYKVSRLAKRRSAEMKEVGFIKRISLLKSALKEFDRDEAKDSLSAGGAAAFKREVFEKVGLFDENLNLGEDIEMSMRLEKMGILIHYFPNNLIMAFGDSNLKQLMTNLFRLGTANYYIQKKHYTLSPYLVIFNMLRRAIINIPFLCLIVAIETKPLLLFSFHFIAIYALMLSKTAGGIWKAIGDIKTGLIKQM